jgi:hypothetical protein
MGAGFPSKGLACTEASLGRRPWAQNIRANHGVRDARARACRALAPIGGSAEPLPSMIPFIVQWTWGLDDLGFVS